jgi:hypothetical protein
MKRIDKLLFSQGNRCFFCNGTIPDKEKSIEHLVALSRRGENVDDNCVVCCVAVNGLLGNLSIKEKFRIMMSQGPSFSCPAAGSTVSEDCETSEGCD